MSAVTATKDRGWIIALIPLGALVLFFVAPMAYMAAVSVFKNDPAAFFKPAFVLDNYAKFFAPFYYSISLRSFVQAGLGAGIVTLLGFFTVLFVSDQSRWLQRFWVILLLSLLCLSEVVIAFALLILFSQSSGIPKLLAWLTLWDNPRSLYPSFGAMMAGYVMLGFSIATLMLFPQVSRRDRAIEEAAQGLGTAPALLFLRVTLPMFRTALVAAFITLFVYFLGVFVMPIMLGGPQNWNMTVIIQDRAVERFNMPLGAALAMIMLALTAVLAALLLWLNRQQRAEDA
jgi:putative spermidine/putrescine transport system permease protein